MLYDCPVDVLGLFQDAGVEILVGGYHDVLVVVLEFHKKMEMVLLVGDIWFSSFVVS